MEYLSIITFIIGSLISFVLLFVVQKMNYTTARYDELCVAILDAANLASDYWLIDAETVCVKRQEVQIHGHQVRINLMFYLFGNEISLINITKAFDRFLDSLTGGEFEVSKRKPDLNRCKDAQISAAELIVLLRDHRKKQLELNLITRFLLF